MGQRRRRGAEPQCWELLEQDEGGAGRVWKGRRWRGHAASLGIRTCCSHAATFTKSDQTPAGSVRSERESRWPPSP